MWGLIVRRIFYYDAVDESRPEEAERQERYFARLRRLPDVHVVLGDVRRRVKGPREQKGVDVQLAVDALEVASSGRVDAIALVTGDADFVPLAGAVRRAGPHVIVMAFPSSLSDRLEAEADRSIFLPEPPPDSWDLWQFERDMGFEE
jgi:uncharacterized LabA/DUF88 family protein